MASGGRRVHGRKARQGKGGEGDDRMERRERKGERCMDERVKVERKEREIEEQREHSKAKE